MKKFYFLLLVLVCACAMPVEIGADLNRASNKFAEAMRWGDSFGAGNFMTDPAREPFLKQFENDDLHVVESRIVAVQLNETDETASADYLLKYYLLPSGRIKEWRWRQQWRLHRKNITSRGVWLIVEGPPAFP